MSNKLSNFHFCVHYIQREKVTPWPSMYREDLTTGGACERRHSGSGDLMVGRGG